MLTDDAMIERLTFDFVACTLPKEAWTHEGHFAAALWLLRHRPELATPDAMRGLICSYNEATGGENTDPAGYHHTITCASLRAAAEYLRLCRDAPLHQVLAALMTSACGGKDWLLSYWSREVLFSVPARRDWTEPDIAPLPF